MSDVNELEVKARAIDAEFKDWCRAIDARGTITDQEAVALRDFMRANRLVLDDFYGIGSHWSAHFYDLLKVFIRRGKLNAFKRAAVLKSLASYCAELNQPFPFENLE
jgi:hypothetical protein